MMGRPSAAECDRELCGYLLVVHLHGSEERIDLPGVLGRVVEECGSDTPDVLSGD